LIQLQQGSNFKSFECMHVVTAVVVESTLIQTINS